MPALTGNARLAFRKLRLLILILPFLFRDPFIDSLVQDIQRQRAVIENSVMKLSNVKVPAQFMFRPRAKLLDLYLSQLVSERLGGPHNVAIYFDHDIVLGLCRILLHEVDGLLASPTKRVHAGVDHQPASAPHLVSQLPKFGVRISVETHLVSETFGIQPPTLDVSRVTGITAEIGQASQLLRASDLQVMSRHRLMQSWRFHLVLRPRLKLVGVDHVKTGARSISGARLIISRGLCRCFVVRNDLQAVRIPGQLSEQLRQFSVRTLRNVAVARDKIFGPGVIETRIGSKKGQEAGERTLEAALLNHRFHFLPYASDFLQSDVVNLL